VTPRAGAWLAAAGSLVAFGAAVFWRMDAAYGPLHLTGHPGDWQVLWELLAHGQIAPRVVLEGVMLGAGAAALPWLVRAVIAGRGRPR
jgi:hypothetical protein